MQLCGIIKGAQSIQPEVRKGHTYPMSGKSMFFVLADARSCVGGVQGVQQGRN